MPKGMLQGRKATTIKPYSSIHRLFKLIPDILRLFSIEVLPLISLESLILPSKITPLRSKSTPRTHSPTITREYLLIDAAIMTKLLNVSLLQLALNQKRLTFIIIAVLRIESSAIMNRQFWTTQRLLSLTDVISKRSIIGLFVGTKRDSCTRLSKIICKRLVYSRIMCKRCTIWAL